MEKALSPMDIDRYIMMAEENFSGADGDYENIITASDIDLNADGDYDNYDGYGADGFYNAGGDGSFYYGADAAQAMPRRSAPMIPAKQPTPYQVVITNSTPTAKNAVVFGMNTFLLTPNFGSDTGLIVVPAQNNVSYLELLQQSANQPFETSLIRVQSANTQQITQILTVTSKDANGQLCQIPIITQSYFSANQFQAGILDVQYPVKIDGNTYISFVVFGSTSLTMTFFPATKINPARMLGGGSDKQIYGAPAVPVAVPMFTARPIGINRKQRMINPRQR